MAAGCISPAAREYQKGASGCRSFRLAAISWSLSAAAAAGLLGAGALADEGPPETTTIRLVKLPSICVAPYYVAEELLHAEGFTDVRYVTVPLPADVEALARGEVDFNVHFSPEFIIPLDVGKPITIIGGVHVGCYELFARKESAASST